MKKRIKLSPKKSKKMFVKTANKTKKQNLQRPPLRGGFRM